MGYRTVVIFDNDNLHLIKDDPNFPTRLFEAIMKQNCFNSPCEVGGSANGMTAGIATVVHCSHADTKVSLRLIDFNAHTIPE